MAFARKVWKLLVAIKDGLVLILMLMFFAGLSAALSGRGDRPNSVRDGALLIKLNGSVVEEQRQADAFAGFTGGNATREIRARDISRALILAAQDERIKAVVVDLTGFMGGGQVSLEEVGAAMDAVRAAKKPVLAYAEMMDDSGMLLAAHASEIWLDPLGGVFVPGPGGYHLYYGKLLERLKITAHVYKVGTYKDFVEPYLRNDQSDPSREARKALYASIWEGWKANVAKARPKADIARVTSDPVGWFQAAGGDAAQAALAAGLVDKIGTYAEFGKHVAEISGADNKDKRPGAFAHTKLGPWLAANPESSTGKAIGVVTIAGEIVEGKAGPGTAGGDRIAALIDSAESRNLAALVVRVDSPGGSVTASEVIRSAIERQKKRGLPVAVSMSNVAASGGYWVSTPATRIFAQPSTITGSIGIFAVIPSFEKLLGSYGVTGDGVRTTPLSGQPDPMTGFTPEIEKLLQANIEAGYTRFIGLVAKSRGKTPEQVDAIAQGRVWDGGTAQQKGLVDQFGGLDDALAWAAKQAKLEDGGWHAEFLAKKPDGFDKFAAMLSSGDDEDDAESGPDAAFAKPHDLAGMVALRQRIGVMRVMADAESLLKGAGAQAKCLDCPNGGAGRIASVGGVASLGFWARMMGILGL